MSGGAFKHYVEMNEELERMEAAVNALRCRRVSGGQAEPIRSTLHRIEMWLLDQVTPQTSEDDACVITSYMKRTKRAEDILDRITRREDLVHVVPA